MTQASQPQLLSSGEVPLSGGMLWVAAMVLAAANFIAVLNLTLANVSVPSIAGSLGATTSVPSDIDIPLKAENSVNSSNELTKTRTEPKRPASQPVKGTVIASPTAKEVITQMP